MVAPGSVDGLVPRPDPTLLTTEALRREISSLRELLNAESSGRAAVIHQRLDGIDHATVLLQTIADRVPGIIDARTEAMKALHDERFRSIQLQFDERDVRTEQTSRDSKVAVDAALQAAKEAVGEQNKSSALAIAKSDAATTKQIDQLGTLIQSTIAGINAQIGDLKDRLTRIEGEGRGRENEDTAHRSSSSNTVSLLSVVIGSLIGLGGLAVALWDRDKSAPAAAPIAYREPSPTQAAPPQIIVMPFQSLPPGATPKP